jgi:hypothetical protein
LADNPEKPVSDVRPDGEAMSGREAEKSAPPKNVIPELVLLAGWLVPGLGHYYIGERRKALIFFAALTSGFIFGAAVSRLECLSFEEHYYAIVAQLGIGILTLPVVLYKHFTGLGATDPYTVNTLMDPGLLYTQVAGLLNLLVALDAFERGMAICAKRNADR